MLKFIFTSEEPIRLKKEMIKQHGKLTKTISDEALRMFKMTGQVLSEDLIKQLKIKFGLTDEDFGKI